MRLLIRISRSLFLPDKAPSDLTGIDERLRSRLAWGLVADIHPTTYDLRLGILQAKREQLGADVPDSCA